MKIFEKCERLDNVARAKEWGLYPYFHVLNTRQDTEVEMEGKKIWGSPRINASSKRA